MKRVLAFFAVWSFLSPVLAHADIYNTYQWNRVNQALGNGKVDGGDWYEWWYYKVTGPGPNDAYFFVYGVVNPQVALAPGQVSQAYVSFGDYSRHEILESTFPTRSFSASYSDTSVKVGANEATDRYLRGSLTNGQGCPVSWDLQIDKKWSFNAMGWGLHFPDLLNIFWYPAQASAVMSGKIDYCGQEIRLSQMPAYQDRNWGRSFPEWWAWLVANRFNDSPDTVLAAGGGKPTLLNEFQPEGMGIGFRYRGKEYVFRPNDGDKVTTDIHFGTWEVTASDKWGHKIEISATAPPQDFMTLKFQSPKGETFYDHEALRGRIRVRLYEWSLTGYRLIADVTSDEGGIEYGSADPGGLDRLFSDSRRLY